MRRAEEEGCSPGAEDTAAKEQDPYGPAAHPWAPASSAPALSRIVYVFTLPSPQTTLGAKGASPHSGGWLTHPGPGGPRVSAAEAGQASTTGK